jgi:hypothetical protein
MRSVATALAVAAFALGAGCAHQYQYTYVPVGPGSAGGPAARFGVPPAAPQGEAYVTSFGFTDFDTGQGPEHVLHARLAVTNGSPMPWTVDGRQQYLAAPGQQPQQPVFLNTDAGAGPEYRVAPGATNVFDLYFAVPPPVDQAPNLTGFAFDWSVDAAGQIVTQQTAFERLDGPPRSYAGYPPYVVVGLGFGVGWWYAPFYPYRHYPPVVRGYYYAPRGTYGGAWRGAPAGGWRAPPPRAGGGWRGTPPASGGWRGTPPASRSQGVPVAPRSRGGGWRGGGGGHGHGGHR